MPPRRSTRSKPKATEAKSEEPLQLVEDRTDVKPNFGIISQPPPPPLIAVDIATLSASELKAYNSQKASALPDLAERKRCHAWPIHKRPLDKFLAPRSGTLCFPRWYRAGGGTRGKEVVEVKVRVGEDLNNIVWKWYDTIVDFNAKEGLYYDGLRNYVAEGIRPHRHEYIGPSPHVAGYTFNSSTLNDIRIEWWDEFLRDQWVENESWTVNVEKVSGTGDWRVAQN